MNRTLKALGLGLLAALAMSAFTVLGASASDLNHTGGHFTQDSGKTATLHGKGGNVGNVHTLHLTAGGRSVTCEETYTGSVSAATVTSVTITPHYTNCKSGEDNAIVHMNGCTYTFTIRQTNASTKHSPVHLACPKDKVVEITIGPGACTVTFAPQIATNAVVYTTTIELEKHAITADITAHELVWSKHGLCEFIAPFGTGPFSGANGASMTGSATLTATNAAGEPVNITATGTNNH